MDNLHFGELICPAAKIFDREMLSIKIDDAVKEVSDATKLRAILVKILGEARAVGMSEIAGAFTKAPLRARSTIASYCYLTDCVVEAAYNAVLRHLHPAQASTTGERLALIAVGGYGRGEMAPFSDVDLLFTVPYKITGWAESVVESLLYVLWDLKLKVGHAVRTVNDCMRLASEDHTIRTSLVEMRFLLGDRTVYKGLQEQLRESLFKGTVQDFTEAKMAERGARHLKQGGQRYVVEPNVKEGKGGLRDLQSVSYTHLTLPTILLV